MRDDLAHAIGFVPAGVIAVVVRVDEHGDALWRTLLQAGDADLGGVHELTVDRDRTVAVDQVADRAALADEHADAAAELFESCYWRCGRCWRLTAEVEG